MNDDQLPATAQAAPALSTTAEAPNLGDMWQSMVALAQDPSVQPEKVTALVDLQERMVDRAARDRFDRAFAQACQNMPKITKDDRIEHNGRFIGWFKKYEDIRAVVDDIINPLGLTVTHDSSEIDGGKGGLLVWTVITYMDSEFTWREARGKMPVPPDTGGAKSAAQAIGSSQTYGQRYSLVAAFGIVQEGLDRDGSTQPQARLTTGAAPSAEVKLLDDAREAASRGFLPYQAFFEGLTNVQRTWLVQNGKTDTHPNHHEKLKAKAERADE